MNEMQKQFLEQGFMEKDQANWIDFNEYLQQPGLTLVDLLQDIAVQHAWLSDNTLQLVKEVTNDIMQKTEIEEYKQKLEILNQ